MALTGLQLFELGFMWGTVFFWTVRLLQPWRNRGAVRDSGLPEGAVGHSYNSKRGHGYVYLDDREADRRRYDLGAGQ